MTDELVELLDMAAYKEIASQAFYIAAQKKTTDPGVIELLKELARQEQKHSRLLKELKEKGTEVSGRCRTDVPNLMIGEYLTGGETLEDAGLQDTFIFAIKREQQAVAFYTSLMGIMKSQEAKCLCEKLAQEELKHKLRLETMYDDLFLVEN